MPVMFLISSDDTSAGSMMGEMKEMMDISEDRADLIEVSSGGAGQSIHSYGNSHLNARGYQKQPILLTNLSRDPLKTSDLRVNSLFSDDGRACSRVQPNRLMSGRTTNGEYL